MTSLLEHQSSDLIKLLAIGDSKTGKTGSLVSLVKAGYKLRVLDMDNLLDVLRYYGQAQCPEQLKNVEFLTFRDKWKSSPIGPVLDGPPQAFVKAMKALDNWPDLGPPAEWGKDCILVIDSLSRLCDASMDFHESMAAAQATKYDRRAVYFSAQNSIENVLGNLTSSSFRTNVIVIAHVMYIDMPDGTKKGFPQSVGQALSPKIAQYFPSVILYTNKGGKRTIQTNSTPLIDLANPAPFLMQPSYPIETGLAEFFSVLRPTTVKPKLRRI